MTTFLSKLKSPDLATFKRRRPAWKTMAFAALVLLLVLLISSTALKNNVDAAALWTSGFARAHPIGGAIIFVLFSALSAMLAFASSAVLVPAAILVWGRLGAFVLLWSGWVLGAAAAYGIGRLANPLLARWGFRKKLKKYQRFVSHQMKFWAVLLFCLGVPSEVPGYLFGSARYNFLKFLIAMGIAESVYAAAVVMAGERLVLLKPSAAVTWAAALIVVGVVIGFLIKRKRREPPG